MLWADYRGSGGSRVSAEPGAWGPWGPDSRSLVWAGAPVGSILGAGPSCLPWPERPLTPGLPLPPRVPAKALLGGSEEGHRGPGWGRGCSLFATSAFSHHPAVGAPQSVATSVRVPVKWPHGLATPHPPGPGRGLALCRHPLKPVHPGPLCGPPIPTPVRSKEKPAGRELGPEQTGPEGHADHREAMPGSPWAVRGYSGVSQGNLASFHSEQQSWLLREPPGRAL